jgi:hypothetical protein
METHDAEDPRVRFAIERTLLAVLGIAMAVHLVFLGH